MNFNTKVYKQPSGPSRLATTVKFFLSALLLLNIKVFAAQKPCELALETIDLNPIQAQGHRALVKHASETSVKEMIKVLINEYHLLNYFGLPRALKLLMYSSETTPANYLRNFLNYVEVNLKDPKSLSQLLEQAEALGMTPAQVANITSFRRELAELSPENSKLAYLALSIVATSEALRIMDETINSELVRITETPTLRQRATKLIRLGMPGIEVTELENLKIRVSELRAQLLVKALSFNVIDPQELPGPSRLHQIKGPSFVQLIEIMKNHGRYGFLDLMNAGVEEFEFIVKSFGDSQIKKDVELQNLLEMFAANLKSDAQVGVISYPGKLRDQFEVFQQTMIVHSRLTRVLLDKAEKELKAIAEVRKMGPRLIWPSNSYEHYEAQMDAMEWNFSRFAKALKLQLNYDIPTQKMDLTNYSRFLSMQFVGRPASPESIERLWTVLGKIKRSPRKD